MKRRLSLAYALIGEPTVVLLDEPFAGLDPPARHALRVEITGARNRGATVVLASHELGEVERFGEPRLHSCRWEHPSRPRPQPWRRSR